MERRNQEPDMTLEQTMDVDSIIAGLSEAQKRYMTAKAELCKPDHWQDMCWMTFPPTNVHRVLIRFGLTEENGRLTPLGLAVRVRLEEGNG
jgi:hypothetical protein